MILGMVSTKVALCLMMDCFIRDGWEIALRSLEFKYAKTA